MRLFPIRSSHSKAVKRTVLALLLLSGLNVQAATIIALFNGELTSEAIQRDVGDGAGFVDTTTGEFSFTITGGTAGTGLATTFLAFCIEPREFVSPGSTYTYTLNPLSAGTTNIGGMGATKAGELAELFGRYYPDFSVTLDAQHASALQIAAWEIVRENSGTLNVLTGNVEYRNAADPAALTLAQTYLSSLNGTGPKLTDVYALTQVGAQDVIVQIRGASITATPEPITSATVGIAMVGLALALRKRNRVR